MGWRWLGASNFRPRRRESRARLEELVEPIHDPPRTVPLIFRAGEGVPLVGIDHQLIFHPESLERVPELVSLRRRHFGIPLPLKGEGGRAHLLDEVDRRATGV